MATFDAPQIDVELGEQKKWSWRSRPGAFVFSLRPVVFGVFWLLAGIGPVSAAENILDLMTGVTGLSVSLIDPETSTCAGSLRISRVHKEYGTQGLFKVAWKPMVILDGVNLAINDSTHWTVLAPQVLGDFSLSRDIPKVVVVRGIVVQVGSLGTLVTGSTASLSASGELIVNSALVICCGKTPRRFAQLRIPLSHPISEIWRLGETDDPGQHQMPIPSPDRQFTAPPRLLSCAPSFLH